MNTNKEIIKELRDIQDMIRAAQQKAHRKMNEWLDEEERCRVDNDKYGEMLTHREVLSQSAVYVELEKLAVNVYARIRELDEEEA